jgi:hypothetical protein
MKSDAVHDFRVPGFGPAVFAVAAQIIPARQLSTS